jgi:hypothetical protein
MWIGAGTIAIGTTFLVLPAVEPMEIYTGIGFILTGIVIDVAGIGIFVTGAHRKAVLKKSKHYNIYKTGSISISPSIGLNQLYSTQYLRLNLSWTF